jgi:hypothetical protein
VFELAAWTADPVAIPLRVWLTVTDPDSGGHGSPQVVIHRQRPRDLRRGVVYDVLIHLSSIKDTRRHGLDGRPLSFPLHFNLGAADADLAPTRAPREEAEAVLGGWDRAGRPPPPGTPALRSIGDRAPMKAAGHSRRSGAASFNGSAGRPTRDAPGSACQDATMAKVPGRGASDMEAAGPQARVLNDQGSGP